MHYEQIRQRLRAIPFQPFRFRLSNNTTYDIRHPEQVAIRRLAVDIGIPAPDLPPDVTDYAVTVSLLHVAELIALPTAAQAAA